MARDVLSAPRGPCNASCAPRNWRIFGWQWHCGLHGWYRRRNSARRRLKEDAMATNEGPRPHCDVRVQTVPVLSPELAAPRLRAIRVIRSKWVNGTVLHYFFIDGPEPQRQAVRNAFQEWKGLGIGLDFVEVADRSEAEVRIAFDQSDGSWSYVGRDVLGIGVVEPTM